MVLLELESVDWQGGTRKFTFCAPELETVLDMTNSLINSGYEFVNITLMQDGNTMELPLAAFDGQAFEETMRHLQNEWQLRLSQPIKRRHTQKQTRLLIQIVELRIDHNKEHIAFLESAVVRLEVYRGQLQHSSCDGPLFASILNRNGIMIEKHHLLLANARNQKDKNTQRLKVLQN